MKSFVKLEVLLNEFVNKKLCVLQNDEYSEVSRMQLNLAKFSQSHIHASQNLVAKNARMQGLKSRLF